MGSSKMWGMRSIFAPRWLSELVPVAFLFDDARTRRSPPIYHRVLGARRCFRWVHLQSEMNSGLKCLQNKGPVFHLLGATKGAFGALRAL